MDEFLTGAAEGAKQKQKLRCIDLFAGIGGVRLGFERAFGCLRN